MAMMLMTAMMILTISDQGSNKEFWQDQVLNPSEQLPRLSCKPLYCKPFYVQSLLLLLRSDTTPVLLLYTIHRLSCFYYLLRLSGSSLSLTWTRPSNAIMTPSPLYRPSLFPFKTAINSISAIDSRTEISSPPIWESTRDRSRLFIANPSQLWCDRTVYDIIVRIQMYCTL